MIGISQVDKIYTFSHIFQMRIEDITVKCIFLDFFSTGGAKSSYSEIFEF